MAPVGDRRLVTGVVAAVGIVPNYRATVSPSEVSGTGSFATVTSSPATVTLTPPATATYQWVQLSGDAMTASSPTSATSTFTAGMPSGQTRSASFTCDVSIGSFVVRSSAVSVQLERS